jgi:putative membrane protein
MVARRSSIVDSPAPARRAPFIATLVLTAVIYTVLAYALTSPQPLYLAPPLAQFVGLAPHLIAIVNAAALYFLYRGWRAVRTGRVRRHRAYMLAAVVFISMFLVLYVTRVVLGGTKAFPGPADVRLFLYLPALTLHIALSILSVPLVIYNVYIGLTLDWRQIRTTTRHPQVGRIAVLLWSISLALGIFVYFLLNVFY